MAAAKKKRLMIEEEYSTVNGALNILWSHITKVLSASSAKTYCSYDGI